MVNESTFNENLELAEQVRDLPGCVVECGVWRGGMIAGLHEVLGPDRNYFLFDSFQGLPPAKDVDGPAAIKYQLDTRSPKYFNNCTASEGEAREAMEIIGARNYEIIAGWFSETLAEFSLFEPIALLRLDADWYESTTACLNNLFDKVASGGLVIIDDYYAWDGCAKAVHDFLSRRQAVERIRNRGAVCYMIKH